MASYNLHPPSVSTRYRSGFRRGRNLQKHKTSNCGFKTVCVVRKAWIKSIVLFYQLTENADLTLQVANLTFTRTPTSQSHHTPKRNTKIKRQCMCSKDANKCDRESRKINITALLSISLSFKWRTHSSHAPCCRLTGMQIVVGSRLRDSSVCVCVTVFSRGASGKKGTPERKQRSRWDWPLLSQIGWTPFWPQGTRGSKNDCCSTQNIILLSKWKASLPTSCWATLLSTERQYWKMGWWHWALQDDKKAVTYTPQQMNSNTTDVQSQEFNRSNHRGEKQVMTDAPI